MDNRAASQISALAPWTLALLAACGGDDTGACVPPGLQGTCVEEVADEVEACFDSEGSCTFVSEDDLTTFEWANGARVEFEGVSLLPETMRVVASDGTVCGEVTTITAAACQGFRQASSSAYFDTCIDTTPSGDIERVRYVCESGAEHSAGNSALAPAACMDQSYGIGGCIGSDGEPFDDPD
jgi:hypothetical protein